MDEDIVRRLQKRITELENSRLWEVAARDGRVYEDVTLHDLVYEAIENADDILYLLDIVARSLEVDSIPADFRSALVAYVRSRVEGALASVDAGLEEHDWNDGPPEIQGGPEDDLASFTPGSFQPHPAHFEFPTESVAYSRQQAYSAESRDWREAGILSLSGYRVGRTRGLRQDQRRRILNWLVLKDDLRDVEDREYAAEWGAPRTSERLKKIVDSIATFARDRKDDPRDYSMAIEHWEDDLEYLRETFYLPWRETWWWPRVGTG